MYADAPNCPTCLQRLLPTRSTVLVNWWCSSCGEEVGSEDRVDGFEAEQWP